MRLKHIKLAGFKSFVDLTRIPFPSPLSAIIGPNGCGKSNVIDAVRWVLGESSARYLRGDAMTDVIFNGSSARRPVSVATVELVFDNREGRLGGPYANYEEIAVKRQVSRDGESLYFLNGLKCRRKDITDLFMGTGLGPRSYAIIEQGMISRLIESKPQELRVFIEEAAGISRYKERRRDTENRIRHARENLERLGDIRLELSRQLEKLALQAEEARRFRDYRQAERRTYEELLVMRYRDICNQTETLAQEIAAQETVLQAAKSAQLMSDAERQALQLALAALVDDEQDTLTAFYLAGTEVARLEQQLAHTQERTHSLKNRLDELNSDISVQQQARRPLLQARDAALVAIERQEHKLLELEEARDVWALSADEAIETLHIARDDASKAERAYQERKSQRALTEQRIVHLKAVIDESGSSLADYRQQLNNLASVESANEEAPVARALDDDIAALERAWAEEASINQHLDAIEAEIAIARQRHSEANGRLSVLVQILGLEGGDTPRLWQCLEVASGWEAAVELALGDLLEQPLQEAIGSCGFERLPSRVWGVIGAPVNLAPWLQRLEFADSLAQGKRLLATRDSGSLILCRDGYLLGQGFMLEKQGAGADKVLLRRKAAQLETEIQSLAAELDQLLARAHTTTSRLADARNRYKDCESALAAARQHAAEQQARWQTNIAHQTETTRQRAFLSAQIDRQSEKQRVALVQLDVAEADLLRQDSELESALGAMQQNNEQLETARRNADQHRASLGNIESTLIQAGAQCTEFANELKFLTQQLGALDEQLARLLQQKALLTDELKLQRGEGVDTDAMAARLQVLVEEQQLRQQTLNKNRQQQRETQAQLDVLLLRQKQEIGKIEKVNTGLDSLILRREGLKGQADSQLAALTEADVHFIEVSEALPVHATVDVWQQKLERLRSKISRLGAINLAAIAEFEEAKVRKEYLDGQDADLIQALESLEQAIRKIDRETRNRFRSTFEQVNADLGKLFPKVFGGGSAYLALTDEDLLETGVTIMARPPGKKNATIHLLSGGEKALTALSLVFAIFRLNPAPFCLLDEVDAPLDDANVDRFCRLLQEMSSSVQFVYISHNKITMQMADHLIGVTMHEPGVSRIVAVDIDEAVAMAHAE